MMARVPRETVKNAKEDMDPEIAEMNEKYAVIRLKAQTVVAYWNPDFELMTFDALNHWLANRLVPISTGKGVKMVPLLQHWKTHPQRRGYEGGVTFDPSRLEVPGKYNLWRGF